MIQSYKELRMWQTAEELFEMVCEDCKKFPNNRIAWTIADQLIRATSSIGSNIAEGFTRQTKKDILHFFTIAYGSAIEAEVWSNRAIKQNLIPQERSTIYLDKLSATFKMILKFKSGLAKSNHTPRLQIN